MNVRLSVLVLGTTLMMLTTSPVKAQSTGSKTSSTSESSNVDPTKEAIKSFKEAKRFYRSGEYLSALESFKKAYKLKSTPAILYNVARCYEKLSRFNDAIKTYEEYTKLRTDPRD